jgi:hypothetical protein
MVAVESLLRDVEPVGCHSAAKKELGVLVQSWRLVFYSKNKSPWRLEIASMSMNLEKISHVARLHSDVKIGTPISIDQLCPPTV